MTNRTIICTILVVLFVVLCRAGSTQVVWQNRSVEDLAGMIRNFEGDPNLAVMEEPIMYVERSVPPPWIDPELFVFDGMVQFRAGVHKYATSRLWQGYLARHDEQFFGDRDAFYGEPYAPAGWASRAMSAESARAIAESFMQTHYPDPQLLTCTAGGPIRADSANNAPIYELYPDFMSSYIFAFRQMLPNGVEGPNTCMVTVDSVFGRIVAYHQRHYPIVVSTTPVLTPEDAMGLTLGQFPGKVAKAVVRLRVTTPDELGLQRLLYHALVEDPPGTGMPAMYGAEIDAHDGSVYEKFEYMGSSIAVGKGLPCAVDRVRPKKRIRPPTIRSNVALSIPPVLIHRVPYLYVGYLAHGDPVRAKRYQRGGRVSIMSPVGLVCFEAGSRRYRINGRERTLSAPPVILERRMYVPVEAFVGVLFSNATYDRAERRLTCELGTRRRAGGDVAMP